MGGSPSKVKHLFRSGRGLLAHTALWIVAPMTLLAIGLILGAVLLYQQATTALVLERDHQLALISATRVSQAFDELAYRLQTWAQESITESVDLVSEASLQTEPDELLALFNAGVAIIDVEGSVVATMPASARPVGQSVYGQPYFEHLREGAEAGFSQVLTDAHTGQDMLLIVAPILDHDVFQGAVLGALHLHNTAIGDPVRRLRVGDEGFAYLVDANGRVIFHPDPEMIGADFSDRPFVREVIAGSSGGRLWENPDGETVVLGYAPLERQGWGLIVRESWSDVVAPAGEYGLIGGLLALAGLAAIGALLWQGTRQITAPVASLSRQAQRMTQGESADPVQPVGIEELDSLSEAFNQMAAQVEQSRAGLRHYLHAVTHAQEAERRRVALELHDETVQSLLAIERRIELLARGPLGAAVREELIALRGQVESTLSEVRRITRDLRPIILEDLGLVPALRALVAQARTWDPPGPSLRFSSSGPCSALPSDLELSIYRVAQEALANIRKHSGAREAEIQLLCSQSELTMIIQDDGQGFVVPANLTELARRGHYGLLGMQERAQALGGELHVEAGPGIGTRLHLHIPLERAGAEGEAPQGGGGAPPAVSDGS